MSMRIEVTAEDIRKGSRRSCFFCPIALACARAGLDPHPRVDYDEGTATIEMTGMGEIELPMECATFIEHFDASGDGEPFAFDLPDATP